MTDSRQWGGRAKRSADARSGAAWPQDGTEARRVWGALMTLHHDDRRLANRLDSDTVRQQAAAWKALADAIVRATDRDAAAKITRRNLDGNERFDRVLKALQAKDQAAGDAEPKAQEPARPRVLRLPGGRRPKG